MLRAFLLADAGLTAQTAVKFKLMGLNFCRVALSLVSPLCKICNFNIFNWDRCNRYKSKHVTTLHTITCYINPYHPINYLDAARCGAGKKILHRSDENNFVVINWLIFPRTKLWEINDICPGDIRPTDVIRKNMIFFIGYFFMNMKMERHNAMHHLLASREPAEPPTPV